MILRKKELIFNEICSLTDRIMELSHGVYNDKTIAALAQRNFILDRLMEGRIR
jgi:hypothetical protein